MFIADNAHHNLLLTKLSEYYKRHYVTVRDVELKLSILTSSFYKAF